MKSRLNCDEFYTDGAEASNLILPKSDPCLLKPEVKKML